MEKPEDGKPASGNPDTYKLENLQSNDATKERKDRDPRIQPAIRLIRKVCERLPPKATWNILIARLGDSPDEYKLRQCWETWNLMGYKPTNLEGLTDWYLNGMPTKENRNGTNQKQFQSASDRNVGYLQEGLARLDSLPPDSGQADHEVTTRLLTAVS